MRTGILVRNIVLFLALFGIVILLISKVKTGQDGVSDPSPTVAGPEQDTTERQIELVGPSNVSGRNAMGESVWEADIKGEWHVDEVTGSIVGNDVQWSVVGSHLEPLEVTAGRFEADKASKMVHFADEVEAELPRDGATVTANEADYDPGKQLLSATGDVVMRRGAMVFTGEHLTADMAAHKIRIRGKVRMTYEE